MLGFLAFIVFFVLPTLFLGSLMIGYLEDYFYMFSSKILTMEYENKNSYVPVKHRYYGFFCVYLEACTTMWTTTPYLYAHESELEAINCFPPRVTRTSYN